MTTLAPTQPDPRTATSTTDAGRTNPFAVVHRPSRARRTIGRIVAPVPASRLSPRKRALSALLTTVSASLFGFLFNLVAISPLQHHAAQQRLFADLRLSLAEGSIPVGPLTWGGQLVEPGMPIALLEADAAGVDREVIVEGTASAQTMSAIGHRRDTVLPCQHGTSVVMARGGAYGGIGRKLARLDTGDELTVKMGQGTCTYRVEGQRLAGDPVPLPLDPGQGRLVVTTSTGGYFPDGVRRIDLTLTEPGFEAPAPAFTSASLTDAEQPMGTDRGSLLGLVLLLPVLIGALATATWLWLTWNRVRTWVVAVPVLLALGVLVSRELNRWLLPNLL